MERKQKKKKLFVLKSRKNECRSLFKKCFKDPIFSLVPFEIWRDLIVCNADVHSLVLLSQTCFAFKELADDFGGKNLNLALSFRKEGQIDLAKKYLLKCVENNVSLAMFHLGIALYYGGWGFDCNLLNAFQWFKKSAELNNGAGMAYYAYCLKHHEEAADMEIDSGGLSSSWGRKALLSNDDYAIGFCHFWGLGTIEDDDKAFSSFEASSKQGNEHAQEWLGDCFYNGRGTLLCREKAFDWFLKSAEQGFCISMHFVGNMYRYGEGCQMDDQKAIIWYKKAAKQGYENSISLLRIMGVNN